MSIVRETLIILLIHHSGSMNTNVDYYYHYEWKFHH
jgi:hypothetical protein